MTDQQLARVQRSRAMTIRKPAAIPGAVTSADFRAATKPTRGWTARLRLIKRAEDRKPIIFADIPRCRSELDSGLADCIAELVAGRLEWPLYLYGPVGTGKTCAALLLCDAVGGGCLYYSVDDAAEQRIAAMKGLLYCDATGSRIHPHQWRARWRGAALGIVDELGIRSEPSAYEYEVVKLLIDTRKGKPLLLIANHPPDRLASLYDQRLASRVSEGTVFELGGSDRRIAP